MKHSTLVVIPARNEGARIGAVIAAIRRVSAAPILVIDDCSTDDTAAVARGAGARVISLPVNLGYGAALQTGFMVARDAGATRVVQLDADGQHDAASIPDLLAALETGDAELVIGCRFHPESDYRMGAVRGAGLTLFRVLLRLLTGRRFSDPTSGFKAWSGAALPFLTSAFYPVDYPDADVLHLLHRAGFCIIEVPARFHPSPPGKRTLHSGLQPVYYVIKMLLSLFINLIRPVPPPLRAGTIARKHGNE